MITSTQFGINTPVPDSVLTVNGGGRFVGGLKVGKNLVFADNGGGGGVINDLNISLTDAVVYVDSLECLTKGANIAGPIVGQGNVILSNGDSGADAASFYLGDKGANGSWRIGLDGTGTNLLIQRRESGSWVTKSTIMP
jgi:hypothetical protein